MCADEFTPDIDDPEYFIEDIVGDYRGSGFPAGEAVAQAWDKVEARVPGRALVVMVATYHDDPEGDGCSFSVPEEYLSDFLSNLVTDPVVTSVKVIR